MHSLEYSFFLIFTGAAVLATLALYTRQPLLLAYIVLGGLIGPFGLALVHDDGLIANISQIGIVFLLFLLGLDLQFRAFMQVLKKAVWVTVLSAILFLAATFVLMKLFGFSTVDALIIGVTTTVSSTILGIKLLPTTVLHHKPLGDMVIGLLLAQDFIAIIALLALAGGADDMNLASMLTIFVSLPLVTIGAMATVRYVLLPLLTRFDRFHEYVFLLAIGWCLGVSELSAVLGLSAEIGAFIAGISLAISPISQYIAENLKPLRDFFLILFFFSVGAGFDTSYLDVIIWPALALTVLMLVLKPLVFFLLLRSQNEVRTGAMEIGVRMGQMSEFSLLLAYLAVTQQIISNEASLVIQAATILLFMASTYLVILRYPSPIAIKESLRRD